MKFLIPSIALLCICLTVSDATLVGDQRLQLFFEYYRPIWRAHRARIYPYAYASPKPLWRLARSVSNETPLYDDDNNNLIACIYAKSKLFCDRNGVSVECDVQKRFLDPLLNNFVAFAITPRKEKQSSYKFNMMPKRMPNHYVNAADLKREQEANKKYTVVSIHPNDLSQDEGFTVLDDSCWTEMYHLLHSPNNTEIMVNVEKVKENGEMWVDKEAIIGQMLVLE